MAEIFRPPVFANIESLQDEQSEVIQNLLLTTLAVVATASPFVSQDFVHNFDPPEDHSAQTEVVPNLLLSTLYVEEFSPSYPEYQDHFELWNESVFDSPQNLLLTTLGTSGVEYTFNPSGTITFSGSVIPLRERIVLPSGTIEFSGSAVPFLRGRAFLPSGSITFSGSAPFTTTVEYQFNPSGSIAFSGTNGFLRERSFLPSGGIEFSGSAGFIRERLIVPSGGIELSGGTGGFVKEKVIAPTRNITFGGTAALIFIPDGAVIGSTINRISLKISRAIGLS